MISHPYVDKYISSWREGKIKVSKYVEKLFYYLENVVLTEPDIYFDEEQIENFITLTETYFFKLEDFQKFLVSFIFLYRKIEGYEDETVFSRFFWTMGRGAGKNGLISALVFYFISELCGIDQYHVALVANSERQAQTSFNEIYDMLHHNPQLVWTAKNRGGLFDVTKTLITSRTTRSTFEYMTSNPNTKDSFRHGVVIFDEIHEYEDWKLINTLVTGLGKVQPPRQFYISTNGNQREGVYDQLLVQAKDVLTHEELVSDLFPFICCLDDKKEVEDEDNWQKANPMFHPPLSQYARGLYREVRNQYHTAKRGEGDMPDFLTKRMNISDVALETTVASPEEVMATARPIPDIPKGTVCIGGLDYASMRDFASVGCLFYIDGEYVWKSHSFVNANYLEVSNMAITPEIPKWEEEGLITVVREPTIGIKHIVNWFVEMREKYDVKKIVCDTYRLDLVRTALEEEGFELEPIRRPGGVEAKIAPEIEMVFAEKRLIYGDNPLMRWFTNNVYVKRDKFGNMSYQKINEKRRKTDGFMAFVHAFWRADELKEAVARDFVLTDFWG